MENITVLGLFVVILLAAIKEIFGWLRQKNLQNSETRLKAVEKSVNDIKSANTKMKDDIFEPMLKKLDILYDWHDLSDQDGVKIWYVKKSLEETMRDTSKAMIIIAKNSELQTRLLEEISSEQKIFRSEQATVIGLVSHTGEKQR